MGVHVQGSQDTQRMEHETLGSPVTASAAPWGAWEESAHTGMQHIRSDKQGGATGLGPQPVPPADSRKNEDAGIRKFTADCS